jgi:hypothetical protein
MVFAAKLLGCLAYHTVQRLTHPILAESLIPAAGSHFDEQGLSGINIGRCELVYDEVRRYMAVLRLLQDRIPS